MAPRLFRRRATEVIDYDELAKKIAPAIARAAANSQGGVSYTPGGATYPVPTPSSPFSQTGGGVMEVPLPRVDATYNSLFGPGYPLIPDPLDPVGPNGRVAPRRWEYLVAWNLQLVDRQVPWTMLRWLAEDCDLVNRCIQLTQDEQCGLNWEWGFSDQILHQIMQETGETNTAKATQIAREQYGDELLMVQHFFESPDRGMNQSFVDWLQALLWDHLVYDGVAIYPRYNLDGTPRNLELVDASSIKIYLDNDGRLPQPPSPAYAQILYGFPRGEFQHTPGEADQEFERDQLAYFIRRPRNTSVYGYPQVEEVMALATTYLARQAWMRAEYTSGVSPKMMVETADTESWTPEQLAYYEQVFNDRLIGQIERRQTAFFLRPGMKALWAPQIDEHYKSDYDNWLISQIASRFGRPPTMLGVQAKAGLSGGKQMQGEMDQSDIYSGKALTAWLIRVLNTLARRYLGCGPEITAKVTGGGSQEDQLQETQAMAAKVNAGWVTRNEARAAEGRPLIAEPEADQLAITTGEGVTFLTGLLAAQEANQQALEAGGTPSQVGGGAAPQGDKAGTTTPAVATKAEGDTPKALAARKAAEAKVAEHYLPKIVDAYRKTYPGVAQAARTAAAAHRNKARKASAPTAPADAAIAATVAQFRAAQKPNLAALTAILSAMHIDAWVVGLAAAAKGPGSDAITRNLAPVALAVPDDWAPGWALANVVQRIPAALQAMLDGNGAKAQQLAGGMLDRICSALSDALVADDPLTDIVGAVRGEVGGGWLPAVVAATETANGAEAATQAAYKSAGFTKWNWVLDGTACAICQARADGNPYGEGDETPPAHARCGCGSEPVTDGE